MNESHLYASNHNPIFMIELKQKLRNTLPFHRPIEEKEQKKSSRSKIDANALECRHEKN